VIALKSFVRAQPLVTFEKECKALMPLTRVKKLTSERALPADQFERVVTVDRVNASAVYSRAGDALGRVDCVLIDNVSGKITYALVVIAAGCTGAPSGLALERPDL
jgi:hypothetical protein